MAITKTNFINYSRCPRYAALEEIKSEKLDADITYKEYKKEEEGECLKEILGSIFEDDAYEVDLTNKVNKQMEAMMPYYKMVEIEAGRITKKYFGGKSVYAEDTFSQESFEFNKNGIKYICYVDIYNEVDNDINIIEVKATTSNKYVNLKASHKKGEKYSIFHFDKDKNCYYLKDEIEGYPLDSEMPLDAYLKQKEKLFDRYSSVGSYIFDLAIQRFILEGEYKESHNEERLKNVHYYLAVLNHNYVFDGTYEGKKAIYNPDNEGNEIVVFFDLTKVTEEYQNIIKQTEASLEEYLFNLNASPCPMGKWCERKKVKECIYLGPVCGKMIPAKNSSLNYLNNGFGFKTLDGERLKGLELINAGYINMLDIPEEWITSKKHEIQRDSLRFNRPYIDTEKIRAGLNALEYPIYHLDFETMPCPMPRFRGEKPYIQSPFEFSLHIEHAPGVCDKEKDNYIFLAKTFDNDEREELVKALCKYIDPDKGTLFAQNVAFEKGRIKELAAIFPEYREKLMKMYNRGFDLLWLVNTKTELYEELGFDKERASLPNYYNKDLSGSYSIKKTLPVFSDLSYKDLTVKNGTEAIVAYASYNKMTKEEYDLYYEALRIYCQQDTWAMVVILQALRELCQIGVKS
ncbi:MAG TPA: DUF2779 domain-containing protein [Candidatus Onthocola stercorigallinarum]|nr:DUF2779 domain-containing protein [Candidatus Onthocola stercorigallinarum]